MEDGNRTVILAASTVDLDRAEVCRGEGIFPLTGKEYAIFLPPLP